MDSSKLNAHLSAFRLPNGNLLEPDHWWDKQVMKLSDDDLLGLFLESLTHQVEMLLFMEHERSVLDHKRRIALIDALPLRFKNIGWSDTVI